MFFGLRYRSDLQIQHRLETSQYDDAETMLLKIPVALPYAAVGKGYQDIRGDFEHKGEFYKLVKQKLENDTLYIVCFKDHTEKHLVKKMIDYGNRSNDLSTPAKQTQNILSKLIKEYNSFYQLAVIQSAGWIMSLSFTRSAVTLTPVEQAVLAPPPKLNA